ncbi:MAG: hypothetical protein WCP19_09785 [Chloroflexota bacterium]
MNEIQTNYSASQGVRLLEKAINEYGPIFSLEQIASLPISQNKTKNQLLKLVSKLARSGWIEILKRGKYVVKSPIYSSEIHPFAIANALLQPIAISHWSALAYHGFSTQNPVMTQASTTCNVITPEMRLGKAYSPRGRAAWRAYGMEFEFIHEKKERFWGFQNIWVNDWYQASITDRERSVLDLFIRPDIFGGIRASSEIMELSLPQIDQAKLVEYAIKYKNGAVIKRIGCLLEKMGINRQLLLPLAEFPVSGKILLDSSKPENNKLNKFWQIIENV